MTAPLTHKVVLPAPQPNILKDEKSLYKFLYEIWRRTGDYSSNLPDLSNLNASVTELNTLQGIRTDEVVQSQLDTKADYSGLGTLAFQDATDINVSGGILDNVAVTNSTITNTSLSVPIGDSGLASEVGAILNVNLTLQGNSGAIETGLISYTLVADSLASNLAFIELHAWGTFAANANNKTVKLKIGSTTLLDTTAVAANSGSWSIKAKVLRKTLTTQQAISEIISDNTLVIDKSSFVDVTEDLGTSLEIRCTGQGTADNDIIQKGLTIKWYSI